MTRLARSWLRGLVHGVPRLLVVGELCADVIVELDQPPVFGDAEMTIRRTVIVLGSSSAITACGAARLGVPASLIGVYGADLLGRFVRDELTRLGVDRSGCVEDATVPTGSSTILVLPGGDRSILTATGSIGAVTTRHVPDRALHGVGHVHVGAYFLQRGLQPDLAAWFRGLRQRAVTTSLDPNFDPSGGWDGGLATVLAEVDVVFCNESEAMAVARASTPPWAVSWLLDRMPVGATVVLKRGARGASTHHREGGESHRVAAAAPPLPGELVDTVGAGDSLAAAFLAARLRGLSRTEALTVGVHNATASTRAVGGTAGQLDWPTASAALAD